MTYFAKRALISFLTETEFVCLYGRPTVPPFLMRRKGTIGNVTSEIYGLDAAHANSENLEKYAIEIFTQNNAQYSVYYSVHA